MDGHHKDVKNNDGGITKTNGTDTLQLSPDATNALNKIKTAQQSPDTISSATKTVNTPSENQ